MSARKQKMFACMLPGSSSSGPGEITIGSLPSTPYSWGTDDGNPFDGFYEYSISLQIYSAAELGNTARTFNKIAFYFKPSSLGSTPWPASTNWCDQEIILAHTTTNYLTTNDNCNLSTLSGVTNVTTVKSSFCIQYTGSAVWVEHAFDTNFNYNGTDNLLVKWVNEENDYHSGGPYFGTTTTGSGIYRAGYAKSGSSPVTNDTLDSTTIERNNIKLFYI